MEQIYHVVMNHEEQYSIWPANKTPVPAGWQTMPCTGSREECLRYIDETWTDITPKSLRS